MRTLYESILDDDDAIKTDTDISLLPREIIKQLKAVFNKDLERESTITRVSSWYPLGLVDDDLYPRDDIREAEDFIERGIKEMYRNVRKTLKKVLIRIGTGKYGTRDSEIYMKKYTIDWWISPNKDVKYTIEISLRADRTLSGDDIEFINIWTRNRDLAELL